jgi:hypothetical protein
MLTLIVVSLNIPRALRRVKPYYEIIDIMPDTVDPPTYRDFPSAGSIWFAPDRNGMIGAFAVLDDGAVPIEALSVDRTEIHEIEAGMFQLPIRGGHQILDPEDVDEEYIALAERGIYVYQSPERKVYHHGDAYEPVVAPLEPIAFGQLPQQLREALDGLGLAWVDFRRYQSVNVRAYLECCVWWWR